MAGYAVEIAAVAADGLPSVEAGDGWELRRYRPSGVWARLGRGSARNPAVAGTAEAVPGAARTGWRTFSVVRRAGRFAGALRRWIFWPHTVRGWWATIGAQLAPADLYHACGSLTIAAALAHRRDHRTGPSGRPARVIYDAIDDVMESNNVIDMPTPVRAIHRWRERRWARSADALITVNEPLADRLGARWGRQPIVVQNYPELQPADVGPPDSERTVGPLRRELGIGLAQPLVLFQGRLGPRLGLDEAAEAVLAVPGAILVVLGFGRGFDRELARDADPRFVGRHRTLAARSPDDLLAWTADADVSLVPLPPVSINQRLSSPNKFWEALAAGTPVVVPASLTYMAGLVASDDLGVVARSETAPDLADAMTRTLERLAADPGWRSRIRAIAAERFAWPVAERGYLDLIGRITGTT